MDDRIFTTGDIMPMFDISRQSARQYAIEFAGYLSPAANPGKGAQRNFSSDDLAVYSLICQMKKRGATYDQIHTELKTGQRGPVPSIAPIQTQTKTDTRLATKERQLLLAQDEIGKQKIELLRKDTQIEFYQAQVERLEKRISDLDREIGQLQASQDDE